jgi:hypothetical protein
LAKPPITSKQAIVEFLTAFRVAMQLGSFYVKHRQKNVQGLADLGLTIDGMKAILAELAVENYASGPEPDDMDASKTVWKFGYDLSGTEIYIKLRLAPVPGKSNVMAATVWSFHKAEYKVKYPHRGA